MGPAPGAGGCRVTRAAPNADAAELAKFDAIAAGFWDPEGEFRPLHLLNPLRTQFIGARAALVGARVLDVGCGGGLLAEGLARAGARVTAIDLAQGMIEVARLHALEARLDIDYRVAAAELLLAETPHAFDVVTCMEMLEHVPDPCAMTATLAQLLRPGGAAFVSTLNRNLKSFLLAIVGAEYLLRLIRRAELAAWARAAGLEMRELAGITFNPLTGRVALSHDVAVNYLAHLQR